MNPEILTIWTFVGKPCTATVFLWFREGTSSPWDAARRCLTTWPQTFFLSPSWSHTQRRRACAG